jgi:hypothetical protein
VAVFAVGRAPENLMRSGPQKPVIDAKAFQVLESGAMRVGANLDAPEPVRCLGDALARRRGLVMGPSSAALVGRSSQTILSIIRGCCADS